MDFKDNLKKLRADKNLSQSELAGALYVTRSTIAKWENGLGLPTEDNIKALCEYFHVNKNTLFGDDSEWAKQVERIKAGYRRKRILIGILTPVLVFATVISVLFPIMFSKSIKVTDVNDIYHKSSVTVTTSTNQEVSLFIMKQPGLFTSGEVLVCDYSGDEISSVIHFKNGWLNYNYKVTGLRIYTLSDSSLYVPASVEYIYEHQYSHERLQPSFTSITVDSGNRHFDSRNDCNCIIDTKTNIVICGSLSSVIPKDVNAVSMAFGFYAYGIRIMDQESSYMEEIRIPGNVKEISDSFWNITTDHLILEEGIETITDSFGAVTADFVILPKSLKKCDCFWDSMSAVYYAGSEEEFLQIETDLEIPSDPVYRTAYKYGMTNGGDFYFYSYAKPSEKGKYWHYDASGNPVVW